jgi:hypothetical protein
VMMHRRGRGQAGRHGQGDGGGERQGDEFQGFSPSSGPANQGSRDLGG